MPTPLILTSTVIVDVEAPLLAPSITVNALHVVAMAVPTPTLVDGRPT